MILLTSKIRLYKRHYADTMASFSSTSNTKHSECTIRIEKHSKMPGQEQNRTKEIWAKAKNAAHDTLWFGYVLPGLLQANDIDTRKMSVSEMCQKISDIWDAKSYEVNGQISVVMDFQHEDLLLRDYDGEKPTRYDKESQKRVVVELNALATIGSNDFRYWVMQGDDWSPPCIPNDCFFGTYPVKYKGEIQKGKFRCVIKLKKQ